MDTRRRARYARIISKIIRALDHEEIDVWIDGQWAEAALDAHSQPSNCKVEFFLFADDAINARRTLEELGYAVVDISPTGFVTERGVCVATWELLWYDDRGQIVTYDQKDTPRIWPAHAFPKEARGRLNDETPVKVLEPSAKLLVVPAAKAASHNIQRKEGLSKVKAIIHDRM